LIKFYFSLLNETAATTAHYVAHQSQLAVTEFSGKK